MATREFSRSIRWAFPRKPAMRRRPQWNSCCNEAAAASGAPSQWLVVGRTERRHSRVHADGRRAFVGSRPLGSPSHGPLVSRGAAAVGGPISSPSIRTIGNLYQPLRAALLRPIRLRPAISPRTAPARSGSRQILPTSRAVARFSARICDHHSSTTASPRVDMTHEALD